MLIEQFIFTVIAFALFVYMFLKMIKNNDTTYVAILVIEAIGIAMNFVEVLFNVELNLFFVILKYVFAILLPIAVIIIEHNNGSLYEMINLKKAEIYMNLGNDKKCKKILLDLLDRNANSYKGHRLLAELYEKEGGMRKAIDEYVQAIDLNKQDYDSYYKVADLLNQLDKKDEAIQMLSNLLNKKPELYDATALLGNILLDKEMYKEAAGVYQNALKFHPTSFDLNYNLGIAYTMLNDFQSAKLYYEKAAELNSLSYHSKYSLAEIALIYKELEEAEKRFLEATEEDELSADSYYELSKISLIKGERDIAISYINTAIDINAKKIVEKVKNDTIFIPIMARISIPFNLQEPEEVTKEKMTQKEKRAKKHLEKMSEITRTLSYHDINLLKKNASSRQNEQELEEELPQKERQD